MVARDDQSVIIEIDTVDKGINQHLSVFLNSHIHATEAVEVTLKMILRDFGLPERDVAMAYRFINKLPLTLVGKVDYRALEKEAEIH